MPSGIRLSDTMNAQLIPVCPDDRPHIRAVETLVARYGLVSIALAVANIALRRKQTARRFDTDLPDRLRRDIGLPPLAPSRRHWEL